MQNRQRHEIVRDILTVCNGGALISRVMFHSYISHGMAKGYLADLIESGLIQTDLFESKKYHTTPKGIAYLTDLDCMHQMLALDVCKAKIIA